MARSDEPDRVRCGERVVFVSDTHLTPAEPEVFLLFLRFLDEVAPGARALYVLGDLFDFWIGPRQARIPGYSEVFRRTRELRDSGTEVYFLPGNRDFPLDGAFAAAQGLRLLPDVARTNLGERRVLLTHGDLLCTADVAYQRMRRIIRSRPARLLFAHLPFRTAVRLAGGFRRASGAEIAKKPAAILEPDLALARAWLEPGYDALIFGHVHKGERWVVRFPDRAADIFVLGSWERVPNYVEYDGSDLRLCRFP